jgi:hypothetical protein
MALEPVEVLGAVVAVLSVAAIGFATLSPPNHIHPVRGNVQTEDASSGKIMAEPLPYPDDPCRSAQALNDAWLAARRKKTHEE